MARQRREDAYKQTVILAWHIAAFDRQKKLPDLASLLVKTSAAAPVPLTPAQQKTQLLMLSEFLGRPVQPAKPKKKKS